MKALNELLRIIDQAKNLDEVRIKMAEAEIELRIEGGDGLCIYSKGKRVRLNTDKVKCPMLYSIALGGELE